MKSSNSNIVRARFFNTLLEIADQVKKNSDSIGASLMLLLGITEKEIYKRHASIE